MKTWLKWLVGILVVVLIVGGIAAGVYWMHTQVLTGNGPLIVRSFGPGNMPHGDMMRPNFERGFGPGNMPHGDMMGPNFERGFGRGEMPHARMMGGRGGGFGYSSFGGLFMLPVMLLRSLLPLAVIGFAIYGVVAWFKRGKPATAAPMSAPVAAKNCTSCGQPVQADWKHCPHCGNTL